MHPNDIKLLRVYARDKGMCVPAESIPSDAEYEVVIEAEAGSTIHGGGGVYSLKVIIRDLVNFTIAGTGNLQGNLAEEPWGDPALSYTFEFPPQGKLKQDHLYEIVAVLNVGEKNPNVSYVKSPLFLICKP